MKAIFRIPTDPYAYVEVVDEFLPNSPDSAVEYVKDMNERFTKAFKEAGEGIPQKEFNAAVDRFNLTQQGDTEQYARMSKVQQDWFRVQRNSFTRLGNNKHGEDNEIE